MSKQDCARCGHRLKDHCKSGVEHENNKEVARMVDVKYRSKKTPCRTRHCKEPLCSCVDFIERKENNHAPTK